MSAARTHAGGALTDVTDVTDVTDDGRETKGECVCDCVPEDTPVPSVTSVTWSQHPPRPRPALAGSLPRGWSR